MKRGLTGHYTPLPSAAGERARAFVPNPLPPVPPLELDADLQELMHNALLAARSATLGLASAAETCTESAAGGNPECSLQGSYHGAIRIHHRPQRHAQIVP